MRHCPECKAEYEDWVTTCADCGAALEPGPAPVEPPAPLPAAVGRWAYATNVPNAILGNLLVNQLQGAGIPAMMRRSPAADIGTFTHDDFVMHDILVPESRVAEARQYISSPPGSPYGGDDPSAEDAGWQLLSPDSGTAPLAPEPADGWPSLPSESDYMQQRSLRKTHGASGQWGTFADLERPGAAPRPDGEDSSAGAPLTQQRWFRVIAGLLFLAASLPWFLSLFQQLGDMLHR